jgi:hypothetical protein
MGYLCACFELSNTARRLLFALREKYAQFGGPAVAGEALDPAGDVFDPAPRRAVVAFNGVCVRTRRRPSRSLLGGDEGLGDPILHQVGCGPVDRRSVREDCERKS